MLPANTAICTGTGKLKHKQQNGRVRGKPPARARRIAMQKHVCGVCGFEYDPADNDNVAFDALPDDWCCPVCGVSKDQFSPA